MKPEFEIEGTPESVQIDSIWVLDGRGRLVEVEVDDDAEDDQTQG